MSDIVDDRTISCVCSSPPYYSGIRKYSEDGKEIKKGIKNKDIIQLGHEKTPEEYVEKMVKYVKECIRTLKNNMLSIKLSYIYIYIQVFGHKSYCTMLKQQSRVAARVT